MSEAAKKAVPRSKRGVPSKSGTGSYPMETRSQAGHAESLASMHHGRNSSFTRKIYAKAKRLGFGKKGRLSDLRMAR